eukprot:2241653-Prymnesium_polylepis.1
MLALALAVEVPRGLLAPCARCATCMKVGVRADAHAPYLAPPVRVVFRRAIAPTRHCGIPPVHDPVHATAFVVKDGVGRVARHPQWWRTCPELVLQLVRPPAEAIGRICQARRLPLTTML